MNMVLRPAIEAQAGETFEISSRAMHIMVRLPFGPPYCSGTQSCISPISPNSFTSSSREAVGLVDLGSDRRHVPGDHPADVVAEGGLLFGEAHGRSPGLFLSEAKKGLPFNG